MRTNASSPTNSRVCTVSFWVKRASLATGGFQTLYGGASSSGQADTIGFGSGTNGAGDQVQIRDSGIGSYNLLTSALYRDPTAHGHLVVAIDTTQATAANRVRIHWNGVEVASFSSASYPALNYSFDWNTASRQWTIGQRHNGSGLWFFDGYLSEVIQVDGQALAPSAFGETNATTGAWVPKRYTGTYGANGFYLPFDDATSTTTIGQDRSGNANNWATSGISVTSGVTFDRMSDTPTNNFATLNRLAEYGNGFVMGASNGNLQSNPGGGSFNKGFLATIPIMPGMATYAEATFTATSADNNGGVAVTPPGNNSPGDTATSVRWMDAATLRTNGAGSSYDSALSSNDVAMVAVNYTDASTCRVWFGRNGTWFASGNPATGANPSVTLNPAGAAMFLGSYHFANAATMVFNFGQRAFAYTPPTGFQALCTANLPTPAIRRGDDGFHAGLRTGTGAPASVTGLRFRPGVVAIKSRSAATQYNAYDEVRGTFRGIEFNTTNFDHNDGETLTALASNGFALGGDANARGSNINAHAYVDWAWRRGSTFGVDVVIWTGNGANRTIAHGLNAVPHMIWVKALNAGTGWYVYHHHMAAAPQGVFHFLNGSTSAGPTTDGTVWNNTAPTGSVFSLGTNTGVNGNGTSFYALVFTAIPGFSAFPKYIGNGSSDGAFLHLGFRPRWFLNKNIGGTAANWFQFDAVRDASNPLVNRLFLNGSGGESGGNALDFVANGVKFRANDPNYNGAVTEYVCAAFAETPFKFATAR
ncbi:MAG: hypothetical protein NBV67_04360 [Tagaea sp.]|nr:hypothetical protein [Tagaea sp.]